MNRLEAFARTLAKDVAPLRALPDAGVRVARLLVVFLVLGLVFFLARGMRPDFALKVASTTYGLETALLASLGILSSWATVVLSLPASRGHAFWRWGWIVGATTWTGVFLGSNLAPSGSFRAPAWSVEPGWGCATELLLVSLPCSAALLWEARRGFVTRPWASGLHAAAGAFTLGLLAIQLSCASDVFAHLLFWHLAPFVALGTSAAVVFRKWIVA